MRVKASFGSEKKAVVIPKNYNHLIQSFLYSHMGEWGDRLHREGYRKGHRVFKMFTFSKLIGKIVGVEKKGGRKFFHFVPPLTIYFGSPVSDVCIALLKGLSQEEKVRVGMEELTLLSAELVPVQVEGKEELDVFCVSPVAVYEFKGKEGEHPYVYYNPWQKQFYSLLESNLKAKYETFYGKPYGGELSIQPVKIKKSYGKKVVYKNLLVKAWEGFYRLKGEKDILELALTAGLGVKNSCGFGMVMEKKFCAL